MVANEKPRFCILNLVISVVLACLFAVQPASVQAGQEISPRIVGGQEAAPDAYPWAVALVYRGNHSYWGQFCSGTLVAPTWVVTAGHCAEGLTAGDIDAVIGRHDLTTATGERIGVNLVVSNPSYDPATLDSDIALLRLSFSSYHAPIDGLIQPWDPDQLARPFTLATVVGWGDTVGNGTYPKSLQEVVVPILPPRIGRTAYGFGFTINMLAAGYRQGGKDACYGDSGGPLVVPGIGGNGWHLAGVVSWGEGCANPRRPGVYSRIERLSPWIELTMNVNE